MDFPRVFLFLLLLISLSFASCSGKITRPVVAVVGDGGGMVNLTLKASPGTGEEYIGLVPYAGVSTQQSARYAVNYARMISSEEVSDCDIMIDFGDLPQGEYVDGPSAGASIAVLAYSLFEDVPVRDDAVITGSLESGGIIGPVGGLYEKARASGANGMKYFITPFTNVYEFITLESVEQQYGIKILQANTIGEVLNFMTGNGTIEEREVSGFRSRVSENTTPYYDEELESFRNVALGMIEFEEYVLEQTPVSNDTAWINEYFMNNIEEQQRYIGLGYYFTAANDAFLNYIEISTINVVFSQDVDLHIKRDGILYCLDSLERPEMTNENFEWVVGSDLRKAWAVNRVNTTDISNSILIEEKYSKYNELMYADAWCRVSMSLAENSPTGGDKINEDAWKELALEKISEAEEFPHTEDTARKLDLAKISYAEGRYGAAILDATYVISMDVVDLEMLEMDDDNLSRLVDEYSEEKRYSMWGKIYNSQALFLKRQNVPDYATAYRLFVYAEELDYSVSQMEMAMEYEDESKNGTNVNNEVVFLVSILIFLLFSFVLLFILPKIKRRSYGNSGKKRGGADRAQQKAVRAGTQKKLSRTKQKRR